MDANGLLHGSRNAPRPRPGRWAFRSATYSGRVARDEQELTTSVVSVTSVPAPESEEQEERIKRYLITMLIRTTCFVLLVVIDSWVRWLFLAGAAFLPYVAVVLANSRSPRVQGQVTGVLPRADDTKHLGG